MENGLEISTVRTAQIAPVTPEELIAAGIEKGLPVETMERLLVMRKELRAEAAKEAYDEAMAAFQAECPVIQKDKAVKFNTKAGGAVDYVYAPMDSIIRQVKDLIAKNGFSYKFKIKEDEGGVEAICIVTHKKGHSESSEFTAGGAGTALMSAAQVTSSKATYAKRNAFCNVFGITTGDEDNDAPKSKEESDAESLATQAQHERIGELAAKCKYTSTEIASKCREKYGVSITQITKTQALGIIGGLMLRLQEIERGPKV